MPSTYNISITADGGVTPNPLSCSHGDKICWTNNNASTVSAFTLPTAVSPQDSPAPIAPGAKTGEFTVNNGTSGNYSYNYTLPHLDDDTKSGTISVS